MGTRVILHPDQQENRGKISFWMLLSKLTPSCQRRTRWVSASIVIRANPDFENKNLWLDIGYRVKDGELEDGKPVALARTPKTSPEFLENHSLSTI